MNNNFKQYIKLMRLNQPTGFLLLFWPCTYGVLLANTSISSAKFIALFLFGSIVMRSAGCIINDIIDKDLDKNVHRTKNRPIASNAISIKSAIILLLFLLITGAFILFSLNATSIYIGLLSLVLVFFYPLMKRITRYPQAFLGLTFNIGALIGYASITNTINISSIIIYIGCWFWTMGYDTIYACQDITDDKRIGIKSTAITFQSSIKFYLQFFYLAMILCFILVGILSNYGFVYYVFISLILLTLIKQIQNLKHKSSQDCMKKFKANGTFIGLLIFIAFVSQYNIS